MRWLRLAHLLTEKWHEPIVCVCECVLALVVNIIMKSLWGIANLLRKETEIEGVRACEQQKETMADQQQLENMKGVAEHLLV